MKLNLRSAKKIVKAGEEKADEIGVPMTIAIFDSGANLIYCERMDGAIIAGVQIAQDKGYSSAATGFGTHQLGEIAQPGQVAYGLANTDKGRMVIFGGGIPLKDGEKVVGAVGASGGLANQDQEVAQAVADAFSK